MKCVRQHYFPPDMPAPKSVNPVYLELRQIYCCRGAEFSRLTLEKGWKEIERLEARVEALEGVQPERLARAWARYTELFGEPPHGTVRQIAAMLELTGEWGEAVKARRPDATSGA